MKLTTSNIIKWSIAQSLFLLGFVRNAKKQALKGDHILSVYFHNPTRKEFESSVKWLKRNNFNFISPDDLVKIANKQVPFPKGAILLTVDDGWRDNEENIVHVANQYKVPVTIFVSTEPVENGNYWWPKVLKASKEAKANIPSVQDLKKISNEERLRLISALPPLSEREAMDIEQIKKIAKSEFVHIGGHTHTHPILPNCSAEQSYEELKISKEKLEQWIGKKVISFAYPNGDYTSREIGILKELGYEVAFTCEPVGITSSKLTSPFKIPRYAFLEGAPIAENICRMMGIWQPLRDKMNLLLFNRKIDYTEYKFLNKTV
ncbi:hypothetical protein GCM10028791_37640 [Echinicola sediminis]